MEYIQIQIHFVKQQDNVTILQAQILESNQPALQCWLFQYVYVTLGQLLNLSEPQLFFYV